MRLYGIMSTDCEYEDFIAQVALNITDLNDNDNIYYTDKKAPYMSSVYNTYDDEEADWMPYNAIIEDYGMFYVDDIWYYEGEEPDDAIEGIRVSEYKEGKLVKQYFRGY